MKIRNIRCHLRNYQLDIPFQNSRSTFTSRNTIILQAFVKDLGFVLAEAAPLDNYGNFTFEQTLERLNEYYSKLRDIDFYSIPELIDAEDNPSIRFALSHIYDSLTHDVNLKQTAFKVFVCALTSIDKFEEFIEKNHYRRVKVKLGILPFEDELEILKRFQSNNNGKFTKLRLDPNESYDAKKIQLLEKYLSKENIEYLEQPVKDIDKLIEIADNSTFDIAADESIYVEESLPKIKESKIKYLIVKPALFGARSDIEKKLIMEGKTLIFSSAFESSVGFNYVNYLAYNISPEVVHGFGTYKFMSEQSRSIDFNINETVYEMYFPMNLLLLND